MLRIEHTTRLWATLLLAAALFMVAGCKKVSGSKDSADQAAQSSGAAYVDADDTYQIKNAPMKGIADALVTIVAFIEFQCPFCARVLPTLDQVLGEYRADLRIVFKSFTR